MSAQPIPEGGAESGVGQNPGASGEANRPAIVVVGRDGATRQRMYRELDRRYSTDYQIVTCDHPPGAVRDRPDGAVSTASGARARPADPSPSVARSQTGVSPMNHSSAPR